MLLVPIGSATTLLTFDVRQNQRCAKCCLWRDFRLRLCYEWGSVCYIPFIVTERQYQLACVVCEHGWIIERSVAEKQLGEDPVPWLHRNGWQIWLGILSLGVAIYLLR